MPDELASIVAKRVLRLAVIVRREAALQFASRKSF